MVKKEATPAPIPLGKNGAQIVTQPSLPAIDLTNGQSGFKGPVKKDAYTAGGTGGSGGDTKTKKKKRKKKGGRVSP
jgi:hypothetical protein